ncbi:MULTISPECIES: NAD(P)H-dependent flavin oxidoreductase [Myroides]|uniref:NAD(P)H-dependent flavin oxidoreductase n=1 Tax=Myroides TaxID=76831 RepID=UPI001303D711|nr:nitronate monooxygenase [Myroides phaeus]
MEQTSSIFNIKYPIIQAPMLGVTSPEMVAAVCNAGAIGTLSLGRLPIAICEELILKTKSLTNCPFIVNLFLHPIVTINKDEMDAMQDVLSELCSTIGYAYDYRDNVEQPSYSELLALVLKHNIKHIAFTFGCFTEEEIFMLHQKGVNLIGTATTLDEAVYLEQKKIDAIVLQGIEAGGHRGSFLSDDIHLNLSLNDLFLQVKEAGIKSKLIVAGGLYNGDVGAAYLKAGADFISYGSYFITAEESLALSYQKELLSQGQPVKTVLTKAFSGKWARGIANDFVILMGKSKVSVPNFPIQNVLTENVRKFAKRKNIYNFSSLWCGINAHHSKVNKTSFLINNLIKEIYE